MEKENRRIKGAHSVEFDNIKFKSALECSCYKKLKESGLEFYYLLCSCIEKLYAL